MEVLLAQPSRTSERHRGLEKHLRQEIQAAQPADATARWQPGQDALNIIYIMRNAIPALASGHSLRSGFITEGASQGVALPALMAMTDHRSVASVIGYFQQGGAVNNPAARLAEAP